MKRAVIVDIDGTLLHSAEQDDRLYRIAVQEILGPVRFRRDLHAYQPVTDTGILMQILEDNRLELTDAVIADVKAEFCAGIAAHFEKHGPFEAVPGARSFLARLKDSATTDIAIATGGWRASAELKLVAAGFDTHGIPLVTSDDALERTEIMQIALDSLQGRYQPVVYYGDGRWDREASRRLGWQFRAVGPELQGIDTFDEEFAD